MNRFISLSLLATLTLWSSSLQEVIALSQKNPSLQSVNEQIEVYEHLYKASQSKNYPSLDLAYGATYLNEKPVMYFNQMSIQAQSQNLYTGALKLTYPLFTGFAISAGVETAKLERDRSILKAEDAKRNLYLGIVQLYVQAVSLKHLINSQNMALNAIEKSYEKVQGFYKQGMIPPSELYRIEANLHETESNIKKSENEYKIALNQLSTLTKSSIDNVEDIPLIEDLNLSELQNEALQRRPDLKAIALMVQEQQSKIKLAKSATYPSVALFGQISQIGDDPSLNGDGYSNKDRSAVGFQLNYNLFSGFETQQRIEAAKVGKVSTQLMLSSYQDKVSSEVYSTYLNYHSLLTQKEASQAQLKAQEAYEQLVEGQFENQLADADQLSRAIASSQLARASLIMINAQLYASYSMALLQVDNKKFLNSLHQK